MQTSQLAWSNFLTNDGPEMMALGLYYSAMTVPEVAQVVMTVKQISGIVSESLQEDKEVDTEVASTSFMAESTVIVPVQSSYGSYALFGLAVTGAGYYFASKSDKKKKDDDFLLP